MKGLDAFKENKINFPGIYTGVVEDDKDPNKAGRVRVRILGIHTENKTKSNSQGIPTNELPWAIPALPIFEGATSGLGIYSVPVKGSWLALFFAGGDHNYPIYFANIAGNPKSGADTSKGFNDPTGKYPTITGEPDWNRNARNESELIKDTKNSNRKTSIPQFRSGSWAEPESPYDAEYPNNTVIETRDGGVVIEYDSTPNKERYHIYHKKSKNYFEISGDGQTVFKSNDNNFEINIKDKNIHINGNLNESITVDKDTLIKGDENVKVEGDVTTNITGNVTTTIDGNELRNIGGTLKVSVVGDVTISSDSKITLDGSGGSIKGVVQGSCICAFTGKPHPMISSTVNSSL